MTNQDDYWRLRESAAPHDRTHDLTVGEQRHGQSTFGAPAFETTPAPSGGGGGGSGLLTLALVTLLFAAPIFGCLYPLAAGTGFVTGLATNSLLALVAPSLGADGRLPFALLAGVVAFWATSRFDHRLADRSTSYRRARHVVRVCLIAAVITVNMLNQQTGGWMPRSVQQVQAITGDSRFLIVMGLSMVAAHFFLVKAKGFREFWHTGLKIVKLRPS